jgi:hypothetical protein
MRASGVLAAALLVLWAHCAAAAETIIGQVTGLRGAVFREADGRREPLAVGAVVRLGDVLASHEGKARVQLNDGTVVSLGERSRLSFADYRGTQNDLTTRLKAASGVFRFWVPRLGEGGFAIETETAVASVRGTDWVMDVAADTAAVAVLEGMVTVSARAPAPAPVLLGPDFGTDVRRGAAPTPPNRWGEQRLATTVARASFD